MYSEDPPTGFYTGNGPIYPSYDNQYPSTFQPNLHTRRDNNHFQQTYNPLINQSNQYDNHIQHPSYTNNNNNNNHIYNFENGGLGSAEYYDRIHAQIRSNGQINNQKQNDSLSITTNNTSFQPQYNQTSSVNPSRQPTPAISNGHTEPTFLVVPAAELNRSSPIVQVIIPEIN